jgi:hypothetical protein
LLGVDGDTQAAISISIATDAKDAPNGRQLAAQLIHQANKLKPHEYQLRLGVLDHSDDLGHRQTHVDFCGRRACADGLPLWIVALRLRSAQGLVAWSCVRHQMRIGSILKRSRF